MATKQKLYLGGLVMCESWQVYKHDLSFVKTMQSIHGSVTLAFTLTQARFWLILPAEKDLITAENCLESKDMC